MVINGESQIIFNNDYINDDLEDSSFYFFKSIDDLKSKFDILEHVHSFDANSMDGELSSLVPVPGFDVTYGCIFYGDMFQSNDNILKWLIYVFICKDRHTKVSKVC